MPKKSSHRLQGLVQSDIRNMTRLCNEAGGINLGQGLCEMPMPREIKDATIAAVEGGLASYSYAEGIVELRQAIAKKLKEDNGIDANPENEIIVSVGSAGAFTDVLHGLLDPGDGVIIFEPYYGYHLNAAIVSGLEPQFIELKPPAFSIDEAMLEAAVSENTRAILICTPSNPSGKMFDKQELELLAGLAHRHDLLVITDEIYEYIRYDGRPHISPATVADLWPRTVSIMGVSKTFSMTGWRLGYAVAPAAMAKSLNLVNDLYSICAPTPLQHGVVAGFSLPRSFFDGLQDAYSRKRTMICDALDACGMSPIVPQGAYYVLADVSSFGYDTAKEAALALLHTAKVAAVPGSAFYRGATGEGLLRFCFAADDVPLAEACRRIAQFKC